MDNTDEYNERFASMTLEALLEIAENQELSREERLAALQELEKRKRSGNDPDTGDSQEKRIQIPRRRYEMNKYNTFWPRFLASIVDSLVIILIMTIPIALFMTVDAPFFYSPNWEIVIDILVYGYFIGMHAKRGQTFGKMAAGVKVVRNSDESPIGLKRAFLRDMVPILLLTIVLVVNILTEFLWSESTSYTLLYYIDNLTSFWLLAEVITMLTNRKRRAIHDFIAGTVVIRTH